MRVIEIRFDIILRNCFFFLNSNCKKKLILEQKDFKILWAVIFFLFRSDSSQFYFKIDFI